MRRSAVPRSFRLTPLLLTLAASTALAAYTPQQKVEVREGDVWSAATVLAQEGRRVHIQYDDKTDEWVPLDRLRLPGGQSAPVAPADAPPADTPPKPNPADRPPASGPCEIKEGDRWKTGVVHNHDGQLYLVELDHWHNQMFWKWVSDDCVRAIGSNKAGPPRGESEGCGEGVEQAKAIAKRKLAAWKAAAKAAADGTERGPFDPLPFDLPVAPADTNAARQLLPDPSPASAKFTPDAAPTGGSPRPVPLRGDRVSGSASVLTGGTTAVVVHARSGDSATVQIEKVDLARGTSTAPQDFDGLSLPIAVSADGKRLVGRANGFFGGTKNRVDLWSIEQDTPKQIVSFEPYAGASGQSDHDVTFAVSPDERHVLTCNEAGRLTLWDVGQGKTPRSAVNAVWQMQLAERPALAASANGKAVAVSSAEGLLLIDALTGDTLRNHADVPKQDGLSFTPDGTAVLATGQGLLTVWTLDADTVSPAIGLRTGVTGDVIGVAPGYALVGNQWLVDLAAKTVVRQYTGAEATGAALGRAWAMVTDQKRRALTPAAMPAAAATAAPLLSPGGKISLDLSIDAKPEDKAAVEKNIRQQLERDGLTVADGQPVTLAVRTDNGKSVEQYWQRDGTPQYMSEKVNVTERISHITYTDHGKVAWERTVTNLPGGRVQGRADESIAQMVQDANVFNLEFLKTVRLPSYVPAANDTPLPVFKWGITGATALPAKSS